MAREVFDKSTHGHIDEGVFPIHHRDGLADDRVRDWDLTDIRIVDGRHVRLREDGCTRIGIHNSSQRLEARQFQFRGEMKSQGSALVLKETTDSVGLGGESEGYGFQMFTGDGRQVCELMVHGHDKQKLFVEQGDVFKPLVFV